VAGMNLLAVEVHQSSVGSSDLAFNLELTGVGYAVAPPPPPSLTIVNLGASVRLSWPSSATGWNLYSILQLTPTNSWTLVGVTPVDNNGARSVILPITAPGGFYRLQKP